MTYENIKESPIYQSKAKGGKTKYWKVKILKLKDDYFLQKEFWQGEDGKHQNSEPYIIEPKNVGRSNETNGEQQSLLEFERAIKKQTDSGYHLESETYEGFKLPMTAYKYKDKSHNIVFPCGIQAKWDGIRACMKDIFWSRKGKEILPGCVEHLQYKSDYILDGELVIEGETFQTITSYVKKVQPDQKRLEFHVFDLMIENMPFQERFKLLLKLSKNFPKNVKVSETYFAKDEEEIMKYHQKFTEFFDYSALERNKMGFFEGTMIRNLNGLYQVNHRSSDLLKLKDFVDEEFEIVDIYEGKGRSAGTITFICKCGEERFHVNPKGSIASRKEMWKNGDKLIGKLLTVEFQEKTERGVPRFPVGKAIRDYE